VTPLLNQRDVDRFVASLTRERGGSQPYSAATATSSTAMPRRLATPAPY
jgi:hypothetical protein